MSWSDLEKPPQDNEAKRKREAKEAALRDAINKTLGSKDGAPLKEYLEAIKDSASYVSGRSPEDVAYSEGHRNLARKLLSYLENDNG